MTDNVNDLGSSNTGVKKGRDKVATFLARLLRAVPLIVALVALSFSLWNAYVTRKAIDVTRIDIDDLQWTRAVNRDKASASSILPDVGTIQFLNNGYSIQLESVTYNANGMYLAGYIGNPKVLWLYNVTIQFTAIQPFYTIRDAFMKASTSPFDRAFLSPDQIGTAQTMPISSLMPGMRERFEVTIPNVKQTKDGVDIRVSLTGERYSYRP